MEKETYDPCLIYARSSADDQRLANIHIKTQVEALKGLAEWYGLDVIGVFTEIGKADKPGDRLVFDSMVKCLEKGEVDYLLCWDINRLYRKSVDDKKIQRLLDKNKFQFIVIMDEMRDDEDLPAPMSANNQARSVDNKPLVQKIYQWFKNAYLNDINELKRKLDPEVNQVEQKFTPVFDAPPLSHSKKKPAKRKA